MRLNLGCGPYRLDGFENLDLEDGWRFEDGLAHYDGTVDGITISHALMYVPVTSWRYVFSELARVLRPGGVLRVTEDDCFDPASSRLGGFDGAVTLTSAGMVADWMAGVGLEPHLVAPEESRFDDLSLVQRWHGDPPKVFHVEGVASTGRPTLSR